MLNVAAVLSDGDSFVDVGANVGIWCCTMARFRSIYPNLGIWAFEANPDTFSRLLRSVEGREVFVENVAITNRTGELEFLPGAVSHVFTTVNNASSATFAGAKRVPVAGRRLDSFEITGGNLVIKIDVEGQELEVLEGAQGFFEAKRVKAVYIDGFKDPAVLGFLRNFGFRTLDGTSLMDFVNEEYVYNIFALAPSVKSQAGPDA